MLGFSSPKGDYNSSRRCNLRDSFTLVSFATLRGSNTPSIGLCSALSGLFSFCSLALIRRLYLRLLTFIPLRGCRKNASVEQARARLGKLLKKEKLGKTEACNLAHRHGLFYDDDNYSYGCAHCCDERFSEMLTGFFSSVGGSLGIPWQHTYGDLDDLTSGPVLEGWIPDDRAHPSQGGHYDMPPGYDWDRIISQMNLFRSTYETMLGQRGSLSCVAEYAAKKWPDDAGELPTDDELMGYCAPIIPPPAP